MNKNNVKISLVFFITALIFFITSIFLNAGYFYTISNDNLIIYQVNQVLCILTLFIIGFIFLTTIRTSLSNIWMYILSFPVGICIWSFLGFWVLLLELPFTYNFMAFILFIFLLLCFFIIIYRKKRKKLLSFSFSLPIFLFILSVSLFVSSGFVYVFLSYDSYYYFINYGNTLTILNNLRDIVGSNSFTITNIGQFLPLLNSYTSFWGLDQSFQIQTFLCLNLIIAFGIGLFEFYKQKSFSNKRAFFYTAIFCLILVTSTSFIIISTWVLANSYCMVFLFLTALLAYMSTKQNNFDVNIIISLFLLALTLLRKDGLVLSCFMLICIYLLKYNKKSHLTFLLVPSILFEFWWIFYVRFRLDASVSQAARTSIANNKNIFFLILIVLATVIFIYFWPFLYSNLIYKVTKCSEISTLMIGLFIASFMLFISKPEPTVDFFDTILKNLFRYPSSWGITPYLFIILLILSILQNKHLNYWNFLWLGYCIINFISYIIAKNGGWVNWDDSYNRILLQIVPIYIYSMGIHIPAADVPKEP